MEELAKMPHFLEYSQRAVRRVGDEVLIELAACSMCGKKIAGPRFDCVLCPHFSVCMLCEPNCAAGKHFEGHYFKVRNSCVAGPGRQSLRRRRRGGCRPHACTQACDASLCTRRVVDGAGGCDRSADGSLTTD